MDGFKKTKISTTLLPKVMSKSIDKKGGVKYFHFFVLVIRRISCPFMVEIKGLINSRRIKKV